ncbi:MAG: hypothetical protein EZS28_015831 [Streblomastix strix]|uniref:Uncharacterized protein n=1 Tax=Streblomastix strix TaxID=222440 RepID=A0A5J4W1L8_9EUKA|nr:MAG: hypothetical protein EZS28_015831 [Streblomastix strix]
MTRTKISIEDVNRLLQLYDPNTNINVNDQQKKSNLSSILSKIGFYGQRNNVNAVEQAINAVVSRNIYIEQSKAATVIQNRVRQWFDQQEQQRLTREQQIQSEQEQLQKYRELDIKELREEFDPELLDEEGTFDAERYRQQQHQLRAQEIEEHKRKYDEKRQARQAQLLDEFHKVEDMNIDILFETDQQEISDYIRTHEKYVYHHLNTDNDVIMLCDMQNEAQFNRIKNISLNRYNKETDLDKHLDSVYDKQKSRCKLNLCFWTVYSFITMPNSKDKRWKDFSRITEAKRIFTRENGVEFRDNYQGFDFLGDIENFINKEQINVHMYTFEDNPPHYELTQNYLVNGSDKQFNILFINDGINAHIMYISDVEALTGFRYCNICHRQAFRIGDKNLQIQMRNHLKKCQKNVGKIVKKVILEKFAKPFIPHILSNKTYKYLLANNLTHLFKPTRYYITYDIETLEKKVNEKFGDSSQVIVTLIPQAIASTVKLAGGIHSFYYDIRTNDFLDKWLEQLFEEAKQVKKDNIYIYDTIPQYYEKLQEILGTGLIKKGRFPNEFINTNNYMDELNKSEPFPIEVFDNKLINKKLSEVKYKEYLIEAAKHKSRWDYLKQYNILDTRVLIETIDYLIELMFKYNVDMLANISMSQCSNAIKYYMAYNGFDINGVYYCESTDKSIEITQNYWRAKVDSYIEQDNKKGRVSSNNVTIDDYDYFKEIFKNQRCHMCNARFTWKNRPTLDRIDNSKGHSKYNVIPCFSVTTFTKHTNFNSFVKEFMNLRQQVKDAKNKGLGQFCKLILNSAFGGDALSSEKYSNTRLISANKTFIQHMLGGFIHSTELIDVLYAVQVDRENYRCNTCLKITYFILDSAKFWYVNFIYNFMNKAYNLNRMHFIQEDTDSLTWAISDNQNRGPDQLFEEVIKDQGFFDRYKDQVFSENGQKQTLHIGVEKYGYNYLALSPKNYIINDEIVLKGVILDQNPQINEQTFVDCINKGTIATAINTTLAQRKGTMSRLKMEKNSITGSHTKKIVLLNQSCLPYINNIKADRYFIKQ